MLIMLITLALVGIEAMRRQKRAALVEEFQFRLFEMRDGLRELALRDPYMRRSWVFAYLDSTTAKAIGVMPRLSVWKLLALEISYKDDQRFEELSANLAREMAKPQLCDLKQYCDDMMKLFADYIIKRHSTLKVCISSVDRIATTARDAVAELRKRSLDVAMKSPETSTLPDYAPDFGKPCLT